MKINTRLSGCHHWLLTVTTGTLISSTNRPNERHTERNRSGCRPQAGRQQHWEDVDHLAQHRNDGHGICSQPLPGGA
jgi:hypothetical protein